MSARTFQSLSWILLSVCVLVAASEGPVSITAELGKTVTLPCQVTSRTPVIVIEWTRPDLGTEYVLFYRDGQFDPENQHPSFKNRVELEEVEPGDASLKLKNVTEADGGIYECHVIQRRTQRRKRASFDSERVKIVNLNVQPGHTNEEPGDAHVGMAVGLSVVVVAVVIVAVVGFVILRKRRLSEQKSNQCPSDDTVELQPMSQ